MQSQARVIAGLKGVIPVLLIVAFGLLGASVLWADLNGRGLNQTQAFLILGPLIYPLFYGCCALLLAFCVLLFRRRRNFLAVTADELKFGTRIISLEDITEVQVTRPFGVKMLVVVPRAGSVSRITGFSLTRPVSQVAADLRKLVPNR